MQLTITDQASKWFRNEMDLAPGNGVRFYGKTYGATNVHKGFSVAMLRDDYPNKPVILVEKDGINYYVNERDEWLFNDYHLTVNVNDDEIGPEYNFS
ncbi:HesB/YadR/YfhF family protein [Periweissella fabalis]|uniref:Iron-sulfur cluster biosynthesis protein n=1 Tax=Periweissella fabalis TaxID=1070421 RepID=A0A7X6N1T0_9LACO|nr:iron-sulfur cluster biosynthesis protein [Periweissella fabalis]MCM0598570.1 iron-sulfur cluster biosynthesis protein [Periweissella fabalis]NKZ24148.1 iron-sulfur cluster biosynthesis protein [Periweissella fabalis]